MERMYRAGWNDATNVIDKKIKALERLHPRPTEKYSAVRKIYNRAWLELLKKFKDDLEWK